MHGIIPLMKPKGWTSHDCVNKIRQILNVQKVGHTGTLDPNVTGVLPICLGEATKTIPFLQPLPKVYEAKITLGVATTTEDADGEITDQVDIISFPTNEKIERVLQSFVGEITQTAPLYSAVKVKGKRLYEYARERRSVKRPQRTVTIHELQRQPEKEPNKRTIAIKVTCSRGTYIRTLAVAIGERLGFPAHMSHLQRTETDSFTIDETVTFSDIEKAKRTNEWHDVMYPVERALVHLPIMRISESLKHRILQGQKLAAPEENLVAPFVMMYKDELLAIYEYDAQRLNTIRPVRVFNMYKE